MTTRPSFRFDLDARLEHARQESEQASIGVLLCKREVQVADQELRIEMAALERVRRHWCESLETERWAWQANQNASKARDPMRRALGRFGSQVAGMQLNHMWLATHAHERHCEQARVGLTAAKSRLREAELRLNRADSLCRGLEELRAEAEAIHSAEINRVVQMANTERAILDDARKRRSTSIRRSKK